MSVPEIGSPGIGIPPSEMIEVTAAAEDEVEPISTTGPDFAQQLDSNVTQQRETDEGPPQSLRTGDAQG